MHKAWPTYKPTDEGSLGSWFAERGARLRRWLGRRTGSPETAADLTQEVCVRLLACADGRREGGWGRMAYRIANQVLIDHYRRTAVRAQVQTEAQDLDAIASPAPGPERILAGRQALARAREALAELPVDCRTAFLLHGLDGLGYAEIAARLGISERMVAKHLARALRHCRDRIASD